MTDAALAACHAQWPQAQITVWGGSHLRGRTWPGVTALVVAPTPVPKAAALAGGGFRELLRKRFDACVIVENNPAGTGYEKLRGLAHWLRGRWGPTWIYEPSAGLLPAGAWRHNLPPPLPAETRPPVPFPPPRPPAATREEAWQGYFHARLDGQATLLSAHRDWYHNQPVIDLIENAVPVGGTLLEAGCGVGLSALYFAIRGYHVTGVEVNEGVAGWARTATVPLSEGRLRIVRADAFALPGDLGTFDLAYSLGVIEHFPREGTIALLREQARHARLVLASIPTPYTRYTGPVTDEHFYSRRELERVFEAAGLAVERAVVYGEVPAAAHERLEAWLPPAVLAAARRHLTYGLNVAVLGRSMV